MVFEYNRDDHGGISIARGLSLWYSNTTGTALVELKHHGYGPGGLHIPHGLSSWYSSTTGTVIVVFEYHRDDPYGTRIP